MSAEMAVRRRAAGVLPDGTAFYAPTGEVLADGPRVVCHLCGRSLRWVAAHLPAHGWTKQEYCAAFGLERRQSLEGPETRKLRAAALTEDWLSRHLSRLDPAAAAAVAAARHCRHDAAWQPALHRLGFPDVPGYLADRHVTAHWTVSAIAAEAGLSYHAVDSALRRHGLARVAHAARQHAAAQRADRVAAGAGFDSITAYITARRGAGWTWPAIAAESGQPPTWLRRRAGP